MFLAFLNPQGNFDPQDSHLTAHPDFGGQLVYVKQVALAIAGLGHRVDILTRQIVDPAWPEFAARFDVYPGVEGVRIVRLPAGPPEFLRKELLWPHLIKAWVPNILQFYQDAGEFPDAFTAHYGDGGLAGVLIEAQTGIPFTFTAHSLGAQKMDKLYITPETLADLNARYYFNTRLLAERLSMNHSGVNITSTEQEQQMQYGHRAYRGAVDVTQDYRFAVIPPGVNLVTFDRDAQAEEEQAVQQIVRARLARDLPTMRRELPCIIASSRLDPKKNHLGLVQAFAYSARLQQLANLIIITGALDDPLHDDRDANATEKEVLAQIREIVNIHNLEGKISAFALPGQTKLAAAYRFLARRRSVFALTALYEPFGLAPLEAAAAGLPLVVTRNGGPSESLWDGDTEYGILVDPADSADIARGLERVLGDRATWAQFAQRGRQRVHDRYTWERTAEGYLKVIEAMIADPTARRPKELLPIPSYLENDTEQALATLRMLYFGTAE
ncbi:MAG: glycosyltransferase [Anaerolineae bacterium]|nr:glycosyltransferase [Anaerolineae bacterium]